MSYLAAPVVRPGHPILGVLPTYIPLIKFEAVSDLENVGFVGINHHRIAYTEKLQYRLFSLASL
jgi:hypothetical protein